MELKHFMLAAAVVTALDSMAQPYEMPTMGWSSWNTFGVNISESIIKGQANAMVSKGLKGVGYTYINIDDGFFGGRDEEGHLLIHPQRFPNGLKPLVDYIHSKGLKAGIYSDAGYNTCGSMFNGDEAGIGVGLYKHDQEDMDLYFKTLDFDFIKVDFCGGSYWHNADHLVLSEQERYTDIRKAMDNVGRDGLRLNVCRWAFPGTWVHDVATSWRTTGDINCSWNSVKGIIAENLYLSAYATEGHYNDMDMLEVGRGLTAEEDKTHFGMWCIMASPLLIGCNMTELNATTLNLLKNKELIALNQDPLALQAYVAQHQDSVYVLVKDIEELHSTCRAVAFYNPTDTKRTTSLQFATVDLGGDVQVRDLFRKKDAGVMTESMEVTVPAHGTCIYRLEAGQRYERTLYEAETAWLSSYQELENNQWKETATYESAPVCSGGVKAGWLGRKAENDLQWRNVYSQWGGDYDMTLSYICGEDRKLTVAVNGKNVKTLTLNSKAWDKVMTKSVKITLQPGENVIRLYNASSWMPDIDCMSLTPLNTAVEDVAPDVTDGNVDVYTIGGQLLRHGVSRRNALDGQSHGAYIVGGRIVIKR